MRQAICILTLLVLAGFTATCVCTRCDITYRVVTANRSSVVIESTISFNPQSYFHPRHRSYILTKAQSECDRYGKDAVLVRRERTRPSLLIISHYRCETR